MTNPHAPKFFVVGGTLKREAPSYISRPADGELFRLTLEGEFCNVLASRQMGKSSLMVRTADRLRKQGVRPVIIDLTRIGSSVTASQWYLSFVAEMAWQLDLDVDVDAWWVDREERGPVQSFTSFLREVVLKEIQAPIVVFVDEIDSTLNLDFTDDFFAAVRATYNARANDERFERLTFVLLGVARPADLIKDRTRTPYNIGTHVDLTDFRIQELGAFREVLQAAYPQQGEQILQWALNWTGGQPYLTQKLCDTLAEHTGSLTQKEIDTYVTQLFLGEKARKESNLMAIRDRVKSSSRLVEILEIYQQVLRGKRVLDEERSLEKNELKLTGLVSVSPTGMLEVRNQVYARVFDKRWVKANLPTSFSRYLAIVATIVAVLAVAVAGYLYYQQQFSPTQMDSQAEILTNQFKNSSSAEVRLTNLADLFWLDDKYLSQGRELFFNLDATSQQALFTELSDFESFGDQLVAVVGYTYQIIEDTPDGMKVLTAMAQSLRQISATNAPSLAAEIELWVQARELASGGQYSEAIPVYNQAMAESENREEPNAGILYDLGIAYKFTRDMDTALTMWEEALAISDALQGRVASLFSTHSDLQNALAGKEGQYPLISAAIATPPKDTQIVGGADKIAFVMSGDVWVADIDGGNVQGLTIDSGDKQNLQWAPDGQSLYYTLGRCIYAVGLDAHTETITCFDEARSLDSFAISPDHSEIALVLDHSLFIIPYDLAGLQGAQTLTDLKHLAACQFFAPYSPYPILQVRWSDDTSQIAALVRHGNPEAYSETIKILDISACVSEMPILDEFPAEHFMIETSGKRPAVSDFDWDGNNFFSLNSSMLDNGFGDLYIYQSENNSGEMVNPVDGACCYGDSRWSPDGQYLIFAFEYVDWAGGELAEVYYVPLSAFNTGTQLEPLQLAIGTSLEQPQFALRAAGP